MFAIVDFLGGALFAAAAAVAKGYARARQWLRPVWERGELLDGRSLRPIRRSSCWCNWITWATRSVSTAMLAALRRRWPRASIEVLASPWNYEVFAAAAEVDRIYVSQVNRFARGIRFPGAWIAATFWWGLWLRRRRIDLGIDVRGEFPLALMLWLSGARRRLGWNCGGGGFLLTDSAEFVPGRAEAASRFALLARLGIEPTALQSSLRTRRCGPAEDPPRASRTGSAGEAARTAGRGARGGRHCGKKWPIEHWQQLIARLVRDYAAQVVLVGSPAERTIALAILGQTAGGEVVDWTGRLRLVELAALLESCDLLVGATGTGPPRGRGGYPRGRAFQWHQRFAAMAAVRRPGAGHPARSGLPTVPSPSVPLGRPSVHEGLAAGARDGGHRSIARRRRSSFTRPICDPCPRERGSREVAFACFV